MMTKRQNNSRLLIVFSRNKFFPIFHIFNTCLKEEKSSTIGKLYYLCYQTNVSTVSRVLKTCF